MSTNTMSTILLTIFVMIGFMSLLGTGLNFMNNSSTIEFYIGVIMVVVAFMAGWICLIKLWKPMFEQYIKEEEK
jgi:amino acid transporter